MRTPSDRHLRRSRRLGFTLVELLTAMGIVVLLAGISVPIILSVIRGDRIRDASSSVQAAITSARERAALDGRAVGIRLVSDPNNPELCRQIILIREADPVSPGSSALGGAIVSNGFNSNYYDTVEIPFDPRFIQAIQTSMPLEFVTLARYNLVNVPALRGYLRLNGTGPYRSFSFFLFDSTLGNPVLRPFASPFTGTEQRTIFILDQPLDFPSAGAAYPVQLSGTRIEINRPPVPLEGADPINLPNGIVIDLGQLPKVGPNGPPFSVPTTVDDGSLRLSRVTARVPRGIVDQTTQAVDFNFDIMFGADRTVIGSSATDDRVILWLRDETAVQAEPNPAVPTQPTLNLFRKEIRADSPDSNSLVVLSTRTGQIATYKPVLVDQDGDGFADWDQYYQNVVEGVTVNP